MGRLLALFGRPTFLKNFHAVATLIWLVLVVPSLLLWRASITWIVFMSVWANVAGHFSSWQAARVEGVQEQQIEDADG